MAERVTIVLQVSVFEDGFEKNWDTEEPDTSKIDKINKWFTDNRKQPLKDLMQHICEHQDIHLYAGEYAYLDDREFIELIKAIDFEDEHQLVLTITGGDEKPTRIYYFTADTRHNFEIYEYE